MYGPTTTTKLDMRHETVGADRVAELLPTVSSERSSDVVRIAVLAIFTSSSPIVLPSTSSNCGAVNDQQPTAGSGMNWRSLAHSGCRASRARRHGRRHGEQRRKRPSATPDAHG